MGGPHNFITEITLSLIGVLTGIEAIPLLGIARKSALHYVAAAFCLCMGAFMAVFGFSLMAPNEATAYALGRATEPMSIIVMPLFLHAIVLLTRGGGTPARSRWQALIYAPAVLLLTLCARGSILYESFFIDEKGVWIAVNKVDDWPYYLYWIYALGCFATGLVCLYSWRFRAREEAEKKLGRALGLATAGVLAVFCLNMIGNLTYLYGSSPWRDYLINLVFSLAFYLWVVVFRRTTVALTGGLAAAAGGRAGRARPERISRYLAEMFSQPVVLLDRELRIEHCGHTAAALFGAESSELRGRAIGELVDAPERLAAERAGRPPEFSVEASAAATGRALTLSFRAVRGEAGLVAGYICQCAEARTASAAEGISLPYGEDISSREYEVLFLLAEGLDVDGIAERLFIAPSTVKSHIHHLYQKTGARNRVELAKLVGAE
jgi:DNA-binding CsgD family transcriptional regulator